MANPPSPKNQKIVHVSSCRRNPFHEWENLKKSDQITEDPIKAYLLSWRFFQPKVKTMIIANMGCSYSSSSSSSSSMEWTPSSSLIVSMTPSGLKVSYRSRSCSEQVLVRVDHSLVEINELADHDHIVLVN